MTNFGLTDGYVVHDGLDQGEVGSNQSTTQHILNIASEFFNINDISINNDKTVAIPINCDGTASFLLISRSLISIAKKGESHRYLGIYLSTEGLLKPSLAKTHSDVWFFSNLVLKKAVSDKQLSYLVLAVLFFIIRYRTQFSYIPISSCKKWDTLIRKGLRFKSGLPCDFPNDTIHHLSLYGLKTFEQVQAKSKLASVVSFANSVGILGHLFFHQSHDLQVLCWCLLHPLQCPVHVKVNSLNNFLVSVVHIFSGCDLSLGGSLTSAFRHQGGTPMSLVLGESNYVKSVFSLRHYGVVFVDQLQNQNGTVFEWKTIKRWKWLDPRGPVPVWFELSVCFLSGMSSLSVCSTLLADHGSSDVLQSHEFGIIGTGLLNSNVGHFSIYTDGSLSDLETVDMKAGAAVFFEDIGMGLGVGVFGLMFSTLMELQAIALALECIPSSYSAALNACRLEMKLVCPDFRNWCWIECHHIVNVIHRKNLNVNWCKVKRHSKVLGNERANKLARAAALSGWHLPHSVDECYLRSGGAAIFGNSRHFIRDIFWSVYCAHWEISCGMGVVVDSLHTDIDCFRSSLVWHLDSHMAAGFTSKRTAGFQTYFMKALYHRLPVAMYHVFSCSFNANGHAQLLDTHAVVWGVCSSLAHFSSGVLQLMSTCVSDISVSTALYKGFVFKDWFHESVFVFKNSRIAGQNIVAFVWLSFGVTRLLGVAKVIGVGFGFRKSCLFFSGIGNEVSVHIGA
ncbi:hypothetical protein G9A89_001517 [Geosiphon pyriformis]|nr:hypothetical protein G9A89_001517 [Geosiphon pyriformis]